MKSISKKRNPAQKKSRGTLIIIGGREEKKGEMAILREIAAQTKDGKMVIVTVASEVPAVLWADYKRVFQSLGVKKISHFSVGHHQEALELKKLRIFDDARTVFFSGGDQVRLTSKIGGTPVFDRIMEIYQKGGIVAGTSAGAAIMGKTMLVGGEGGESHKVGNWMMAPGLGFIEDLVIDQHFAQRGRIGRLLGAVALNPGILGIGIDEDTAIVVKGDSFKVIGANAAYVVDGRYVTTTNVSEAAANETMSVHDIHLHILANRESFNLATRKITDAKKT
jgi:cyanophycinase